MAISNIRRKATDKGSIKMNEGDLRLLGEDVLDSWKRFTEAANRVMENYKALMNDIDELNPQDD